MLSIPGGGKPGVSGGPVATRGSWTGDGQLRAGDLFVGSTTSESEFVGLSSGSGKVSGMEFLFSSFSTPKCGIIVEAKGDTPRCVWSGTKALTSATCETSKAKKKTKRFMVSPTNKATECLIMVTVGNGRRPCH